MGLKKYRPSSDGLRSRQILSYEELTSQKPKKSLTKGKKTGSGRNNVGQLVVRRRGGGNKRKYRSIDFKRSKDNVEGFIKTIEYDPNRTAFISLVHYKDGDQRYILTPAKASVNDSIMSGDVADIKIGNTLPLSSIPPGSIIHNIELTIGKGAQLVRSAGAHAVLQSKGDKYANVKLPSGETRLINLKCRATMGSVSNSDKRNVVIGKAGANRWKNRRPKVRGAVMNACDHPHGGGEGRAPVGRSGPMTPWGKPTLGYKTRKRNDKFIVRKRK